MPPLVGNPSGEQAHPMSPMNPTSPMNPMKHVLILKDESCQTSVRESTKAIQTLPLEGLVPEAEYHSRVSQLTKEKNEIVLENNELKSQINQLQKAVIESKGNWESLTLKAYKKIKDMDMENQILTTELKALKLQVSSLEKEYCRGSK